MKNLLIVLMLVVLLSTPMVSLANSLQEKYNKVGIDNVVIDFLKDGVQVNTIVVDCLEIQGLNPQNLVRALYCAGAKGEDIKNASERNGISEQIFVAGYKKSIDECQDKVEDSQAYTPTAVSFSGPSAAGRSGGGLVYASPSTF